MTHVGRYLLLILIACGSFFVEFVGVEHTHSQSLLGDSFHMLGDGLAFGAGLIGVMCKGTPAGRVLEVFLRRFNAIFLFAVSFILALQGFHLLQSPTTVLGLSAIPYALLSLVSNTAQWYLAPEEDAHENAETAHSQWEHLRGDLYSSGTVLLAAIIVALTHVSQVDALLSLVVAYINFLLGNKVWQSIRAAV